MKALLFKIIGSCIALIPTLMYGQSSKSEASLSNYRIAYNIHVPDTTRDDWEVMTMKPDGSDKRNVTTNRDVAWTYLAVEDKLFFISDRDTCYRCFFLYSSDAFGQQVERISNLRLEDSWMSQKPGTNELVVSGRIGNQLRYQLFRIDLNSGAYTQLTSDTAAMYRDPCYAPDGKQLVFSYKPKRREKMPYEELYIMEADGTGLRQLTTYPAANSSAADFGYKAGAPRWHPSGKFISYISKQDGRHSIFAITPDGKQGWKLLKEPGSDGWHDWSPDGQWLTYNQSDDAETQYHIMLMHWPTKKTTQLTDNSLRTQMAPVFVATTHAPSP